MRKFITLAVALFLGYVSADKCAANGSCPAGYHCNEFKFCIAGFLPFEDPVGAKCNDDGSCPAGQHCNEFKFCIDGASQTFLQ